MPNGSLPPLASVTANDLPGPASSPLDAARRYMELGLQVVPVCAPRDGGGCTAFALNSHKPCQVKGSRKPGKVPVTGWQNGGVSPEEAARRWGGTAPIGPNIALLMGPAYVLGIDVDGPRGEEELARAASVLGPLPDTLENLTAHGRHGAYFAPEDATEEELAALVGSGASLRFDASARRFTTARDRGETNPASTGLDVRAGSPDHPAGYIVVSPSRHVEGHVYRWRGGPIARLPRAWFDALPRKGEPRRAAPTDGATFLADLAAPARRDERPARQVNEPRARISEGERQRARFSAALPAILSEISSAPEGARNSTLRDGSVRALRLAMGAGVDTGSVAEDLAAAAERAGLPRDEGARTITSAMHFARKEGPADLSERAPPSRHARALEPSARPSPQTDTARPVVETGPDLHRVVDEALSALAAHPDVYQRAAVGLVRVVLAPSPGEDLSERARELAPPPGSPVIEAIPPASITEYLSAAATFQGKDSRGEARWIQPPGSVVAAVHARRPYPAKVRPLVGIIEAPTLRRDGSVLVSPGYDPASGLYLRWHGAPLDVPEAPSRDEARAAYNELAALFSDFVFSGGAEGRAISTAAIVAAILSPLAREAIGGPVPAFVFEADGPDAGKTLAALVCGTLVTGRPPAVRQYTPDDDEMAKRIAAVALAGSPVWLLDNVRDHIQGGALELVLTAHGTIGARVLGSSTDRELPWRAVTYLTANGASYSRDVSRRVVHISLRARGSLGTDETGRMVRTFSIPNLLEHVAERRSTLLRAGLVILRAHIAAGAPCDGEVLPTFEAWSRRVGGAVCWSSGVDPVRARPPEGCDRDTDIARRIALAWCASGLAPSPLGDLRRALDAAAANKPGADPRAHDALLDLRDALSELVGGDLGRASPVTLGKRFSTVEGREFQAPGGGTVAVVRAGKRNGSQRYEGRYTPPAGGSTVGDEPPPYPAGQGDRGIEGDSQALSRNEGEEVPEEWWT